MTAPARDHLRRAANMYELFAFTKATSEPQYLALVDNGLTSIESGGTWFPTSWQNDISWATRSKVRTHIFSKLTSKLHSPCSMYSHLYQTHPDIPLTFENGKEMCHHEPCAVLIESHAFVTASSSVKYLERVTDGIWNVLNGRQWNDLTGLPTLTSDERHKVRSNILTKLKGMVHASLSSVYPACCLYPLTFLSHITESNALEAKPQSLEQRVKSFESYAFRKAASRSQYFERIAAGLSNHDACTKAQASERLEYKEYIGKPARIQCRKFIEANLKCKFSHHYSTPCTTRSYQLSTLTS